MKDLKHINLVRKIAWSFHKTTGLDWNELFAEALFAYAEAFRTFSNEQGSLSNWLWTCMNGQLNNFIKNERRNKFVEFDIATMDQPVSTKPFFEIYDALSSDSKQIVDVIFEDPKLYLCVPTKIAQQIISVQLIREKDWTWDRTKRGMKKLQKELAKL